MLFGMATLASSVVVGAENLNLENTVRTFWDIGSVRVPRLNEHIELCFMERVDLCYRVRYDTRYLNNY
jgi:hypothetical protein